MIHLGRDTSSRIISKGIAAGHSNNTYRGLVSAHRRATNARNFTNCDSLLIGSKCGAHTRGLSPEEAVALIVNGFVRDVLQQLPMEFMAETQKLIGISLEGSVG
jgi:Fe-S cluster assembly protein SufB